jgi:hypothetical protein
MKQTIFLLILALSINLCVLAAEKSPWKDHMQRAVELIAAEKADNCPRTLSVLVELRRAWIAIDDPTLKSPIYEQLRALLEATYREHNLPTLAGWYKTASLSDINSKIREKYQEGKTLYLNDWKSRMDEFGMITIWRPDSLKARKQPTVFYYKPGDESYADALTLSHLEPGQVKAVDFDLSSFAGVGGPTYGPGTEICW